VEKINHARTRGEFACEAGESIKPGVKRGFASATPGKAVKSLGPAKAGRQKARSHSSRARFAGAICPARLSEGFARRASLHPRLYALARFAGHVKAQPNLRGTPRFVGHVKAQPNLRGTPR